MITFLLQEGVITVGTISGIFTALLINSAKNNIIDPIVEKIAPLNKIHTEEINNITLPQSNQEGSLRNIIGNQFGGIGKDKIKMNIFIRDFITWLIIMILLYLAWKHILHPIKNKSGISTPTHNTQFIPMNAGMGKKK